ncbi:cytochrome b [Pseudomonas syringae]|uniref:cytochrome b n=1 Tax=Pseudomonas syringae TaxID=317 RepID=UPI0002A78EC5|nr:cytochrome b [Pseudomonas syringae]ELP95457.1 putative cytochrome b561 [Pseudomonas syringae BRIP34876]ELP98393.1 putative cytochrome b561 [Pseudomonas syringae BRIP34881]
MTTETRTVIKNSQGNEAGQPERFNLVAQMLHWTMAAAILAMLFIGVTMMTSLTWRPDLLDLHQPLGIAILLLAIVRLVNRLRHGAPVLPADIPRWQVISAKASHWVLYALMLLLPLLGWGVRSAGGWPVTMFPGVTLPPIAPIHSVWYAVLRDAHGQLAWFLFAVVLVHLSAALMHAWVRRDGVFSTMTPRGLYRRYRLNRK